MLVGSSDVPYPPHPPYLAGQSLKVDSGKVCHFNWGIGGDRGLSHRTGGISFCPGGPNAAESCPPEARRMNLDVDTLGFRGRYCLRRPLITTLRGLGGLNIIMISR